MIVARRRGPWPEVVTGWLDSFGTRCGRAAELASSVRFLAAPFQIWCSTDTRAVTDPVPPALDRRHQHPPFGLVPSVLRGVWTCIAAFLLTAERSTPCTCLPESFDADVGQPRGGEGMGKVRTEQHPFRVAARLRVCLDSTMRRIAIRNLEWAAAAAVLAAMRLSTAFGSWHAPPDHLLHR